MLDISVAGKQKTMTSISATAKLTIKKLVTVRIRGDRKTTAITKKLPTKPTANTKRPKKDQCSLCLSFKEGDAAIKEDLKDKYEKHILEKQLVRQKKSESKEKAKTDSDILCAVFDLQQNVATRECSCFVWDETNGKRGSTEIATCLFKAIGQYVGKGVHTIELFCDGCYGQNKHSVVASMLQYSLAKYY
ncbi:unnamed protein product [Ceutorhynchus assimilis]|uniref:Uncharacterized protein n=1 Tax=Ceutorhynchus assimilis TaxID=467358 RepID=A0A9N9MM88_9CUCU|nr:unnamed protein product [Ceutorhynchus assimilis]